MPDATPPTLYILCGLPFSGKSTLAQAIAETTAADVVSLDDINAERGLFGGDGIPVEEWERTHGIAVQRTGALLARGTSVVLDDTTSRRFLRDRYREVARRAGANAVLVHLDIPLDEIRHRREHSREAGDRRGLVDRVFDETATTFEAPGSDEERLVYRGEEVAAWWRHHGDGTASS